MLKRRYEFKAEFFDTDPMGIMWHGNYVKFLEDGREAFGEEFGLSYLKIFNSGYFAPIVDLHIKYKKTASMGDVLIVETTYVPTKSAKLMFDYKITRESDGATILKASTTQLFVTKQGEFEITVPEFIREWRKENNL